MCLNALEQKELCLLVAIMKILISSRACFEMRRPQASSGKQFIQSQLPVCCKERVYFLRSVSVPLLQHRKLGIPHAQRVASQHSIYTGLSCINAHP
jgi:hypothetical protein